MSKGFTLLGAPKVSARIRARGDNGQVVARLWAISEAGHQLVSRGVYRLRDDQSGRLRLSMHPAGWRFAKGTRFRLELLGRDVPFVRASSTPFRVRISRLSLVLPTAEKPSRKRGIVAR